MQLIKHFLLENESRYVILHNQALPNFSHSRRGHGGKTYSHGERRFFVRFDPAFFPSFPLSFPPFPFAFSYAFCMLGHLSCP